jgi:hypothetical protein
MPILSGNEVLAAIEERPVDCRVAMVTAVDPDFDIIEMASMTTSSSRSPKTKSKRSSTASS